MVDGMEGLEVDGVEVQGVEVVGVLVQGWSWKWTRGGEVEG